MKFSAEFCDGGWPEAAPVIFFILILYLLSLIEIRLIVEIARLQN